MAFSRYIVPFVAFMAGPALVQSLELEYCARVNTGSTPTNSSIYQSNGLCFDYCVAQTFALAIVQEHDCWCSDYIPNKKAQVDTGDCNDPCPGWPPEFCGAKNLYGYIILNEQPKGTAGGDDDLPSPSPTPTAQPSTHVEEASSTSTLVVTSTLVIRPPATSTSATSATSENSSTTLPKATTKTTTTETKPTETKTTETKITPPPTPSQSVKTITVDGTVSRQTIYVTPTPAGTDAAQEVNGAPSHEGLSKGSIAGIVIGVLAILAIGGLAFLLLRRRRRRREELDSRPPSNLSSSLGILGTPTTPMASVWDGEHMLAGHRTSRLMPHDPRMDPFATNIYSRENKSRESINTLQDNQDYSRKVLRTTNPDPPDA